MITIALKEAGYYLGILVLLSLYMHPERISIIESFDQIIHPFLWTFLVYIFVLILRLNINMVIKKFKK